VSQLLAFLRAGYGKKSWVALGLLVTVGGIVGYRWSDLLDANGTMDWFLAGTWIGMALLITWDVDPRRDAVLLLVGFVGGGVIEWWGTNTQLWTYFTQERPPLWILPAWPIATLAIDRLWRIGDRAITELDSPAENDRRFRIAYWLCVPTFVASMIFFARHTLHIFATQVVAVGMVLLVLRLKRPRRDFLVFAAGSFLGIFLEYWGTSRECWTYYTKEVPPMIATVAHGFAAIAFARGADLVELGLRTLTDFASARSGRSPARASRET
jgi:hypothetical protein